MIQKLKKLLRRKPDHVKLWEHIARYADKHSIYVPDPTKQPPRPPRVAKAVGQHIMTQYWTKGA